MESAAMNPVYAGARHLGRQPDVPPAAMRMASAVCPPLRLHRASTVQGRGKS